MILRTTVVEAIQENIMSEREIMAHYFFNASERQKLTAVNVLESFVKQLIGALGRNNAVPSEVNRTIMRFYAPRPKAPEPGSQAERSLLRHGVVKRAAREHLVNFPSRPDIRELTNEILVPLLAVATSCIFIVDGLDECTDEGNERLGLMGAFQTMINHGAKISISSRLEVCVTNHIENTQTIRVSKQEEGISSDVLRVIDVEIANHMRFDRIITQPEVLHELRRTLMEKADAMYVTHTLHSRVIVWHAKHLPDLRCALLGIMDLADEHPGSYGSTCSSMAYGKTARTMPKCLCSSKSYRRPSRKHIKGV
jgi:hypothetical protein